MLLGDVGIIHCVGLNAISHLMTLARCGFIRLICHRHLASYYDVASKKCVNQLLNSCFVVIKEW